MKLRLSRTILFFASSLLFATCSMNVSDADKLIDDASIRSSDVRLKKLVFEMSSYHQHELHDLETWKTDWGIELNTRFPGNLTSQELNDLRVISEMDYDVKWLTLMIKHHEGAIEIANRLLASSSNPKTTSIALKVKKTQSIEIHSMRELLWTLCNVPNSRSVCVD
jgi:uncharacterized protein (DUF305 family)